MSKKYAYVDCFEEMKDVPLKNPLIKYLGDKTLKKYLLNKFPNTIEDVTYAGVPGNYIRIPLIKTLINEDQEYIKEVIHAFNDLLENEDVNVLILDESLMPYRQEFRAIVSNSTSLGLFFIKSILDETKIMLRKKEKDIRYILVDGPSTDSEYVLDHISEEVNTLTLVTDQPKRYEEKLQQIYEDSGLAVQVKNKSLRQKLEGEIIINCSRSYEKLFYCYDENALLIDFLSQEDILYKTKIKRKDLKIINRFDVSYLEQKWRPEVILGILLSEDRLMRNIYMGGYRYNLKEKIDKVVDRYPLKFELKSF